MSPREQLRVVLLPANLRRTVRIAVVANLGLLAGQREQLA